MTLRRKGSLAEEIVWYESNKTSWLKSHQGQFVLIGGKKTAGFFANYEAAFEAGLETFGVGANFLIKQVVEQEPVFVIY